MPEEILAPARFEVSVIEFPRFWAPPLKSVSAYFFFILVLCLLKKELIDPSASLSPPFLVGVMLDFSE